MQHFKCINGWTPELMIERIRSRNNGQLSLDKDCQSRHGRYRENLESTGNACWLGCFIPDSLYQKSMDVDSTGYWANVGPGKLVRDYPELSKHMPLESNGLKWLQSRHDWLNAIGKPVDCLTEMESAIKAHCYSGTDPLLKLGFTNV